MDGQLCPGCMQLLAEIAGRPATGLLAVGQENDDPWLVAAGSQSELAQARVIFWEGSGAIPFEQTFCFADRQIVD